MKELPMITDDNCVMRGTPTMGHWTRWARLIIFLVAVNPVLAAGQTVEYIHTDALGSPVATTDTFGNVIERNEYEPYGMMIGSALKDGPGYTGQVTDAATGLTYMQQRYYDPVLGRFLSMDPVSADNGTGANFNRYWYANNNPYKFTDPDGRCAKPTGSNICSQILDRAKNAVTRFVAGKTVQAAETAVGSMKSALKNHLDNYNYSAQFGVSGTIAAPLKSGTKLPSAALAAQANFAINHRGQLSFTASLAPLAGAGFGAAGGLNYGGSRTEGGNAPRGLSFSRNHHAEAAVSLPEVPFAFGGSVDWTDGGASMSGGSARVSAGQIMFIGAGEQMNITYTFNGASEVDE